MSLTAAWDNYARKDEPSQMGVAEGCVCVDVCVCVCVCVSLCVSVCGWVGGCGCVGVSVRGSTAEVPCICLLCPCLWGRGDVGLGVRVRGCACTGGCMGMGG